MLTRQLESLDPKTATMGTVAEQLRQGITDIMDRAVQARSESSETLQTANHFVCLAEDGVEIRRASIVRKQKRFRRVTGSKIISESVEFENLTRPFCALIVERDFQETGLPGTKKTPVSSGLKATFRQQPMRLIDDRTLNFEDRQRQQGGPVLWMTNEMGVRCPQPLDPEITLEAFNRQNPRLINGLMWTLDMAMAAVSGEVQLPEQVDIAAVPDPHRKPKAQIASEALDYTGQTFYGTVM